MFRVYIPEGVGAFLARVCIPLEKHTAITQHEFELPRMWRVRLREFMNSAVGSGDVQALAACVDHAVDRLA